MLHMPTPMLLGGAVVHTEAEFQAHIAVLAVDGVADWSSGGISVGTRRVTAGFVGGGLTGTSWQSFTGSNSYCRTIQHGMPNEPTFNRQVAAGRQILITVTSAGAVSAFTGIDRNGFASASYSDGNSYQAYLTTRLLYYDDGPFQIYPSTGVGPSPYSWSS